MREGGFVGYFVGYFGCAVNWHSCHQPVSSFSRNDERIQIWRSQMPECTFKFHHGLIRNRKASSKCNQHCNQQSRRILSVFLDKILKVFLGQIPSVFLGNQFSSGISLQTICAVDNVVTVWLYEDSLIKADIKRFKKITKFNSNQPAIKSEPKDT